LENSFTSEFANPPIGVGELLTVITNTITITITIILKQCETVSLLGETGQTFALFLEKKKRSLGNPPVWSKIAPLRWLRLYDLSDLPDPSACCPSLYEPTGDPSDTRRHIRKTTPMLWPLTHYGRGLAT
jgi:hypothetical protein